MSSFNISLDKADIFMIMEALEGLQADVKHSNDNGHSTNYPYNEQQVETLITKLDEFLENNY
jgi:hypothetical protein